MVEFLLDEGAPRSNPRPYPAPPGISDSDNSIVPFLLFLSTEMLRTLHVLT